LEDSPSKLDLGLGLSNWHQRVCAPREAAAVSFKNILFYALIAFIIWWVIQQPANAAHLVHNIGSLLTTAANGLSHFVASI
jgi:hypothetical protein